MKQTSAAVVPRDTIPGVYRYCDQWCAYCALTSQCTLHRCAAAHEERSGSRDFTDFGDVVEFTREVASAEGLDTPELDALLSPDPAVRASVPDVDADPLQRLAVRYARQAGRFLVSTGWMPPDDVPVQPAPVDVVAWFHVFIALRISRALVAAAQAARGQGDRLADANGCAKIALIGIDRSRAALGRLGGERGGAEIARLLETLDELGAKLQGRFPAARTFVRPGLDAVA